MSRRAHAVSWFEIAEARAALAGEALTMREEWLERVGPVRCERCGRPIRAGQGFRLAPYCPMGGRLELAPEALVAFGDVLEVSAWHAGCKGSEPR